MISINQAHAVGEKIHSIIVKMECVLTAAELDDLIDYSTWQIRHSDLDHHAKIIWENVREFAMMRLDEINEEEKV